MSLPVISLDKLDNTDESARLRDVTHEVGFFHLVDHGIPAGLEAELLGVSRALFALSDADKATIDMTNSAQFRGFTRLGGERTQGRQDWREQIDVGPERPVITEPVNAWDVLEGPNQWPAALPELRDVLGRWQVELTSIARRLLAAWARSLQQDESIFDDAFADRPSTLLKIVRYPAVGAEARPDGQGVGAHKDPGVLTLLWVEPGAGGLQVQRGEEWIEASPVPGGLVVNIGELLEWATDGYLQATVHRVTSPVAADRISVPFFFNPALDSRIPRLTLPAELRRAARGVTDDPANKITDVFGANLLKARLRAHPDVAARHHATLSSRA